MPDDNDALLRRLIGGDARAPDQILARARTSTSPALLVAAAVVRNAPEDLLHRAERCATSTRDRQLVAIAAAHLSGDEDRLDALVRDHLADNPDNILAAWIAAKHTHPGPSITSHR